MRHKVKKIIKGLDPSRQVLRLAHKAGGGVYALATNGRMAIVSRVCGNIGDADKIIDVPVEVLPEINEDLEQDIDSSGTESCPAWTLSRKRKNDLQVPVNPAIKGYSLNGDSIPDVNEEYITLSFEIQELNLLMEAITKEAGSLTFFVARQETDNTSRHIVPIMIRDSSVGAMMALTEGRNWRPKRYNECRDAWLEANNEEVTKQTMTVCDSEKLIKQILGDAE
jgi:hypothetical protein